MAKLGAQVVVIIILVSPMFLSPLLSLPLVTVDGSMLSAQDVAYRSHAPITIRYNDDFASQGWNGTGTAEDPFIIEHLNITTDWDACIYICGTDLHLIIRNCVLHSLRSSAIYLSSASNCVVESCNVVEVSLYRCNKCSIISNDFQGYGLDLLSSRNISVIHNKMGSPLWISGESEEDWRHTIVNNTVNGEPLVFIHDENSLLINPDDYGSLILLNCTNVNIANGSLTPRQGAIQLSYCRHTSISHNMGYVIYCTQSSDLRIRQNSMAANVTMGIALFGSNDTLVESNSIYANRLNGIGVFSSENCTVRANTVIGEMGYVRSGQDGYVTYDGIALVSSVGCLVDDNTVDMNPSSGIYAKHCPLLQVKGNLITNNHGSGIEIFGGNGTISKNTLHSNKASGIGLSGYQNSTIQGNDIYNNNRGITAKYGCFNVTISNNEIHDVSTDIVLDESRSFRIKDNLLYGSGLLINYGPLSEWHHIIENNTLNGGSIGYLWGQSNESIRVSDYGFTQLIIVNSTALHIYDGQFSHSRFLAAYCDNLDVENISFDHSSLSLVGSETSTMQGCVFSGGSTLEFYISTGCIVRSCIFNQSLLVLSGSEAIQVRSNIFQHRGAELLLTCSSHCLVSDNEFVNSGVSFYGYWLEHWIHDFSNNTVNNKPLGYFKQLSDTSINTSDYGALVLADCHGLNVSGGVFQDSCLGIQMGFCTDCVVSSVDCIDNYECGLRVILSPNCILEDSVVTDSEYGIDIGTTAGSVEDVIVSNCTVTNNTFGIFVTYDDGVKILNSTISNNEQSGITLEYSSHAYIENSTIYMNGQDGISCYYDADNCTIVGNNITANSQDGIQYLGGGSTAAGNYIVENGRHGILVSGSNSLIYDNWIVANNDSGIEISYSGNSTISSNVVCNNTAYGIHIEGSSTDWVSSNNTIYVNLIGWNDAGNAYDDGLTNMWDSGSIGNAWSDYNGSGSYLIPGSAGSIDHFPRLLELFPVTSNTEKPVDEFQLLPLFLLLLISAEIGAALFILLWSRRSPLEYGAVVETVLH